MKTMTRKEARDVLRKHGHLMTSNERQPYYDIAYRDDDGNAYCWRCLDHTERAGQMCTACVSE